MAKRSLDLDAPINELLGSLKGQTPTKTAEPIKAEPKPTKAKSEPKQEATAPKGYKLNPQFIEKKTIRLQLVLKESTSQKLRKYCKENNTSINDYIGKLIDKELGE